MTSLAAQPGTVYLVGAGPGNPDLLTLRALRLLQTATSILHDDLVSPEILALANPLATLTSVGKRCGRARVTQAQTNDLMVAGARNGQAVLRLKSGDPLLFGRAAEELDALRAAAIPVEIVPGITAAFAAAAALHIPLTGRSTAARLILATGHHSPDRTAAPPIWSGPLPHDSTLALYMPGRHLGTVAHDLIASGLPPGTPVTAISAISTPRQQTRTVTLSTLHTEPTPPTPLLLLLSTSPAKIQGSESFTAVKVGETVLSEDPPAE